MKKLYSLLLAMMLTVSSNSFAKEFGNFIVDLEVGGIQDGWSQSGSNMNSARFTGYADLDFRYKFNDQFSIFQENAVNEESDDFHTLVYSHGLKLQYDNNVIDLSFGGAVTDTDNDQPAEGNQQESFFLYEAGYTTAEHGIRFGVEYLQELSDGSVNSSNQRYAEDIFKYMIEKTFDAPFGIGKNVVVELNWWDIDGVRDVYSADFEFNLADNYGIGLLVGENDGKGIFANNAQTNRDFAAVRAFVKY